eukprot:CAMPEP_0117657860 /NCGR_PEP_ID=MMETSP0804-20121206/5554_1 /TAXON_ID=1074897 /ORGANISM="Tetraselmis astigmatica, Strain CCMP880" /LENGTH=206 /DNA_ID=CAMNT_0005464339 /DNA_START=254 /DNA_END=874 /DNA_ORIENTATION=+
MLHPLEAVDVSRHADMKAKHPSATFTTLYLLLLCASSVQVESRVVCEMENGGFSCRFESPSLSSSGPSFSPTSSLFGPPVLSQPSPSFQPSPQVFTPPFWQPPPACLRQNPGRTVGEAACTEVINHCLFFVGNADTRKACDGQEKQCLDTAPRSAQTNPACIRLLKTGGSGCSAKQAQDLFRSAIGERCGPVCEFCDKVAREAGWS